MELVLCLSRPILDFKPRLGGTQDSRLHTHTFLDAAQRPGNPGARAPERKGRGRAGPRSRWRGRVTSDAEVSAPCGRLGREGGVSLVRGVCRGGPPGFLDQSKGRKESHVLVNNKLG